jgi:hypothetical protein
LPCKVLEIGKISEALAALETHESQLMMDAIENYDDQAKATIRSLSRLIYASSAGQYRQIRYNPRLFVLQLTNSTFVG